MDEPIRVIAPLNIESLFTFLVHLPPNIHGRPSGAMCSEGLTRLQYFWGGGGGGGEVGLARSA